MDKYCVTKIDINQFFQNSIIKKLVFGLLLNYKLN